MAKTKVEPTLETQLEPTEPLESQSSSPPTPPPPKPSPEELKRAKDNWTRMVFLFSGAAILGGAYLHLLWLIALFPVGWLLGNVKAAANDQRKLEITNRVSQTISQQFQAQGVEVFSPVPIEVTKPLDLFVRFPNKKFFLISLKAVKQGIIFYNERRELICLKRESGITKYNRPDPIADSKQQEIWLRKNRRDLFGGSSRDSRRPVIRVLVFAQEATLGEHKDDLYATIGNQKFLQIRNSNGVIYLISEANICEFIQANLD